MKMFSRKVMWGFMIALILALLCCASAMAASGTWGDLTWNLDDEGTLTISGTGDMEGFWSANVVDAWLANRASIKQVRIEDGVTSIGEWAFSSCSLYLCLPFFC